MFAISCLITVHHQKMLLIACKLWLVHRWFLQCVDRGWGGSYLK